MSTRREMLKGAVALALGSVFGGSAYPSPKPGTISGPVPRVMGPITGGRHGRPFASYFGDISDVGYVEEEYFLDGEATAYEFVGEFPANGRFNVSKAGSAPYRTRILVRRPADPAQFNGTVVVEWINVSSGFEIACVDPKGIYQGFAWVSVSAQRVGVHGYERAIASRPDLPIDKGLRDWDAERYASLSLPGDSFSYDIFTQGARAVGPHRSGPTDPMGGLEVRKLIAVGASQSGTRLVSYINGVQKTEKVFDALMPLVFFGASAQWIDGLPSFLAGPSEPKQAGQTQIREDISAKVLALNSEMEARAYLPVRQPDTDRFRYWEIAGASHGGTAQAEEIRRITERDGVAFPEEEHPLHISDVLWRPTCDAAIHQVHRWINGGEPPPLQRKIEFDTSLTPPEPVRDQNGNALGGVRLPELEVPIAQYVGSSEASPYAGQTFPFTPDKLKRLYPTHEDYVGKVRAAAENAVREGVILPYRAEEYVAQAQAAAIPVS